MKRKGKNQRFLLEGFFAVVIISVAIFLALMNRMADRSKNATLEIANFYIERMSAQITNHFKTVIDIKLSQVESIILTMPPDGELQGEELRKDMIASGRARKFCFLGLLDEAGNMEVLFGDGLEIANLDQFTHSLQEGRSDIAWSVSEEQQERIVLLGSPCDYVMKGGQKSIALVGGIDIDFIQNTLALGDRDGDTYSYIIRQNGDFVIKGESVSQSNFYERQQEIITGNAEKSKEAYIAEMKSAIDAGKDYTIMLPIGEENKYLYIASLDYADWYLITITSYNTLDDIISRLDRQRVSFFLVAMLATFLLFSVVFVVFYEMTRKQILETEKAREEAERANKAKSEFLSNMSHDIRTPMNAIVGMTEILLRRGLDRTERNYLTNIKNSSAALLTLINNILDFSKIESGKIEIVEEEYDIVSMLNDLGTSFLNLIGDKPVELLFDIDRYLPQKLCGDPVRIRQILINIINNAIKFTDAGSVELCIRVERFLQEKRVVLHVAVKDTGQGIRQEDLGKLFHTFQQVDTKKNRNKEGTGLGLSISRQLVEAMGGTISVTSEYGIGSEFDFTIPQKVAEWQPAASLQPLLLSRQVTVSARMESPLLEDVVGRLSQQYELNYIDWHNALLNQERVDFLFVDGAIYQKLKDSGEVRRIPPGTELCLLQNPMKENYWDEPAAVLDKPLYMLNFCRTLNHEAVELQAAYGEEVGFTAPDAKILIVDDTPMNLEVALGLLKPLQMKVYTADSGKRAIDMVRRNRYDIVLMDHMMPGMDGIETTQKIRSMEDPYLKTLPILALTANAVVDAREAFARAGMNDFIAKPIDFRNLCAKLKQWLPEEKIRLSDAPAAQRAEPETGGDALPQIAGLDVREGIRNSGSRELFLKLLGDFYRLIDLKSSKIEQCLAEGLIRDYTTEVHAMKTAARTIGALELSDFFARMEWCGSAGNQETLERETPALLELYRSYKPILEPYGKKAEAEKRGTDAEELTGILRELCGAVESFDLDRIDGAYEKLEALQMPEQLEEPMQRLRVSVADVAMEQIVETCRAMMETLRQTRTEHKGSERDADSDDRGGSAELSAGTASEQAGTDGVPGASSSGGSGGDPKRAGAG